MRKRDTTKQKLSWFGWISGQIDGGVLRLERSDHTDNEINVKQVEKTGLYFRDIFFTTKIILRNGTNVRGIKRSLQLECGLFGSTSALC